MTDTAFLVTGQYKRSSDAAVRGSLHNAFAPGAIDEDVQCPDTHRMVVVKGSLGDVKQSVRDGSFAVRGRFSTRKDVGGCETPKALRMLLANIATRAIGFGAIVGRPDVMIGAMESVRNPGRRAMRRGNLARRHRNPAPKARTYAIARADILRALRADGWDVRENLKVPHATHPSGEFRLWLKTQAIYYSTGDRRRGVGSLSDAHSLWIGDIRTMPVAEVFADIERARRQSVAPQRNPSPRQNQEWRRHHQSAAVQAGIIQKDYALAAHHYAEAAKYVADKPKLVAYYRSEAEKYRGLARASK